MSDGTISRLKVLFAASEAFPLAKAGGLGDVAAALPSYLHDLGVDIRVILPGYPQALDMLANPRVVGMVETPLGDVRLLEGTTPDTGLPVYLCDAPNLFARDGNLYQEANGADWQDNHLRFATFCHAIAAMARGLTPVAWSPDIVHVNDWHTGLVPALMSDADTAAPRTVFTLHNLAFQGNFPLSTAGTLGLRPELLTPDGVEFYGRLSFLKAGIRYGDRLTTVSPTYAKEILTPEYGCGLEGVLASRAADLTGILNGIDDRVWNPAVDPAIAERYTSETLDGKRTCKTAVQDEFGLERSDAPLIVYVNRLTHQKMADIVLKALPGVLDSGAQLALHGQGEPGLQTAFREAADRYPGRVAVRIGYDEDMAHRLNAAGDMSLTPSRFEPCGLTTMYAMRYGALPISRRVGGIADTVVDAKQTASGPNDGTGFLFEGETADAMSACVRRASETFRSTDWPRVQTAAMRRDFGWRRSAERYLALYRDLRRMPVGERVVRDAA